MSKEIFILDESENDLKPFEISCDKSNLLYYTQAEFPTVWSHYLASHDIAAAYEEVGIKLIFHELTNYSQVVNGRRVGWSPFLYGDFPKPTEQSIFGNVAIPIDF